MDTGRIIYNRDSLIALDKPAGTVSYKQKGKIEIDAYDLVSKLTGVDRNDLRAVNRLDRGTSGIMLFATSKESARHYSNLLKNKKVLKEYVVIAEGQWDESNKIIDTPIKICSKRCYVDPDNGKSARTRVYIKELFENHSLLTVIIETGRKHQIRAHLASYGNPVAGDVLYGGTKVIEDQEIPWPLLHSVKTIIPQGGDNSLKLEAPIPPIFKSVMALLTILIFLLLPSQVMATDNSLYRNPPADMTWETPDGWKKTAPPEKNSGDTAKGGSRSWFSFDNGLGHLRISCENSPLSNLNDLSKILTTLIKEKKMKIDKFPELTTYGQYRALRIISPPETDHPLDVGRIFVYFAGSKKEISLKMAASSKIWEQSLKDFTDSLSSINIGILHREYSTKSLSDKSTRTVLSDANGLWSVLIPENYERLPSSGGDNLFILSKGDSKSTVELSVKYCPSIHAITLMEFFTTNIAMAGLTISKCSTGYQHQWPAVTIEAQTQIDAHDVNLYYRLIKVGQFVFTITGICPRDEKKTLDKEFAGISQSIKLGSEFYGSDYYVNPSSIYPVDSTVSETLFETIAAIHSRSPKLQSRVDISLGDEEKDTDEESGQKSQKDDNLPFNNERIGPDKGTLSLLIPPSYLPYQKVIVGGWSQIPDTLKIDSLGNIENRFFIKDPGRRARERVAAKYRVTSTRTLITPMEGRTFNLPPALKYRYTLSSTNVPYKHPRVVSFTKRWIRDDEAMKREDIVATLLKAVNLLTKPEETKPSAPMDGTDSDGQSVARMQWGSGALFALAHPHTCGPSERADLLTAALRDRNIPVRRLYGHLLDSSKKTMTPHVWCEVFIPPAGWVPADPNSLTKNEQPTLGLWSERYVFISKEGPNFVVKSGPDRALLQEGYSRADTKIMDVGIEVTRAIIYETAH